ncbi:MAG: hypothetical protein FWE35_12590 [Streptosporangiales bacterium]|nr:hypothetical protein [Streptosporangiales bacterium]
MARSGAAPDAIRPAASRTAAAARAGDSSGSRHRAASGARSARVTRWSRISLSGRPSAAPPAVGRNRTPAITPPGRVPARTGPVSGPAR